MRQITHISLRTDIKTVWNRNRNYVKITSMTLLGPRISAPTEKMKTAEAKYEPGSTVKV